MDVSKNEGSPMVLLQMSKCSEPPNIKPGLDEGNKEGAIGDPSKTHGVKRRNILHNLPYWKVMM